MSGAYWLYIMYYGGDVRHIELHGVGSFLVCLFVSGVGVPESIAIFQGRSDN